MMRSLSPMTSIGRRGSGSSMGSQTPSDIGSVHSAQRLMVPKRQDSAVVDMNMSDVWVPPDIQRVGSPSGSPLVVVPTPEVLRLNEVPEPTHVVEVSRWRSVTGNVLGGVLTLTLIVGIYYGIYAWVKNGQKNA